MDTKSYLAGLGTLPALAATALAARVGFVQAVNRCEYFTAVQRRRSPWPLVAIVLDRRTPYLAVACPGSDVQYDFGFPHAQPDDFKVLHLVAPPLRPGARRFGVTRFVRDGDGAYRVAS